jgi:hypothetical protein
VTWIAIAAWIGAVVLAVVVFGFCGYELMWKANRLRADLARLTALSGELAAVQADLTAVSERGAELARAAQAR